jgi:capsular exopolysaccharide synthesis family protein
MAESFRATLASVLLSSRHRQAVQVILVTSPSPGEGKSTIAANLAVEIARAHRRVLLIDADVKRPRLHEHFRAVNEWGWTTALNKAEPLNESDLDRLIQPTDVPGLSLLTSGPDETGSTRLLYSARSAELLAYCRRHYSTVLIDTPPLLGISDARVIGRRADAVVLVCRSGKTTREAALAAKQRLEEDGTPILGVVLNDWKPGRNAAAYYDVRYTSASTSL